MSDIGISMATAAKAIDRFREMLEDADLEGTLLRGWPSSELPSDLEAMAIESAFNELGLHEPDLDEDRRWYLAGQIITRIAWDRTRSDHNPA